MAVIRFHDSTGKSKGSVQNNDIYIAKAQQTISSHP